MKITVFQFSQDEACECEYVSEGFKFLGKMTKYGDSFTFHGSKEEEEHYSDHASLEPSSRLVANWNVSSTRIVQTTTLVSSSGPSGKIQKSLFF